MNLGAKPKDLHSTYFFKYSFGIRDTESWPSPSTLDRSRRYIRYGMVFQKRVSTHSHEYCYEHPVHSVIS